MGEKQLLIATDSEYVVLGYRVGPYLGAKGWLTSSKKPLKNQDPWKARLTAITSFN
jgi:ribonuclease HI